ncbi:kelch domain-containing protein 1-like [Dunckerocampus dactyliophorus]|uniref:kelch domain-containing protein 1-like n=1 Tax=Dunckerocampus dactyliophorus TaxID=161453 RepID=UPI0024074157|nr:kelch domain-containing protein 1-like [Dunckerocampus dactyliophorus]
MTAAAREASTSRLERSSHTAFIHNNTLHVWGGYQVIAGEDVVLPSDEIWICDLDSGMWERREMSGEVPRDLMGFCGSYVNGSLYVFAGCDQQGYSNKMFSVDLMQQCYLWKKVPASKGTPPSPRTKHSCWVHGDRLIYFGGYGCKTILEVRNATLSTFVIEEMSWTTIGDTLFRCWGWNNEVNVFDTHTTTWSVPETQGPVPTHRGCHASAVVGSKGYVCGGVESADLDLFCLDLDKWTWTQFNVSPCCAPLGRSMHTMTPTSDHTLFVFGGLGADGSTLNDAWQFDTLRREWSKMTHPHKDKPRVCHSACLGSESDVVVFGGSSNLRILMDSVAVLRAPSQHHCRDVFIFQTQPYSLFRLCEDFLGRNAALLGRRLAWLPTKLRGKVEKRVAFFSLPSP